MDKKEILKKMASKITKEMSKDKDKSKLDYLKKKIK